MFLEFSNVRGDKATGEHHPKFQPVDPQEVSVRRARLTDESGLPTSKAPTSWTSRHRQTKDSFREGHTLRPWTRGPCESFVSFDGPTKMFFPTWTSSLA